MLLLYHIRPPDANAYLKAVELVINGTLRHMVHRQRPEKPSGIRLEQNSPVILIQNPGRNGEFVVDRIFDGLDIIVGNFLIREIDHFPGL